MSEINENTRIIDLSVADLRSLIRDEISDGISAVQPIDEFEHIKRFSTEDAARYLGLSVSSVQNYRSEGKISYYKSVGGRFSHFTREQLDEYRDLYVKNSIRSVVCNQTSYRL